MPETQLHIEIERWPLKSPFRITGYVFEAIEIIVVTLERDGAIGRGEAHGVYYLGDSAPKLVDEIEECRSPIERGVNRRELCSLLRPGGARNAVDCALWDLEAKLAGAPVWRLAGLDEPRPIVTAFTCGADEASRMADNVREMKSAKAIKLKLTGEPADADRVRAVRSARSDVWLGIDANQGFDRDSLNALMPVLVEADVQLIEQPFPRNRDSWLDGLQSPIRIASDESIHKASDVAGAAGRFDVINIKLDKCGGLTEALDMVRIARGLGLGVMIGNMMGTSLSIAPCYAMASCCDIADLDGPMFLAEDREPVMTFDGGLACCPPSLWGYP